MKKSNGEKNVKFSIRSKLVVIMALMSLGTFICYLVFSMLFLDEYYTDTKKKSVVSAYEKLNGIFSNNNELDDELIESVSNLCAKTGITCFITEGSGNIVYSYGNGSLLQHRLESSLFNGFRNDKNEKVEVIEQNSDYVLQTFYSEGEYKEKKTEYMEMWGVLDNGYIFIIRIAIENIEESIRIFFEFLIYVATFILIVSIIIADMISRKFSKPITKLTRISEKMSELDFNVKYEDSSRDEINVLGNTMNMLSDKLEATITELKNANSELQRDIKQKDKIDEMRKEFISNVSHELKTPIALIQGYAEGLMENINDDVESREFYCEVIIDEATKMNKMVRKLLTLNQLEFGNTILSYERFNIVDVIHGVITKCALLIEQSDATIEMKGYDVINVWADEFQIEEVITNYLTNALNHLKYDKIITISIEKRDEKVRIIVNNTGDNIEESELNNIWVKFYKVDKARTREYGGNGIGLSIVKAIMEAHNNGCGVNNTENGVDFWFELDGK